MANRDATVEKGVAPAIGTSKELVHAKLLPEWRLSGLPENGVPHRNLLRGNRVELELVSHRAVRGVYVKPFTRDATALGARNVKPYPGIVPIRCLPKL